MERVMSKQEYTHPEPVPHATQLAVAPFLAAVDGYLRAGETVPYLRITMHRLMNREGQVYLQQVSPYFPLANGDAQRGVGRLFAVTEGMIGKAYRKKRVFRTRQYEDEASLMQDLRADMQEVKDTRNINDVATSYLAVPFLDASDDVVLILYADCKRFNFFADNHRIEAIAAMCHGFARLFDVLQAHPFPNLRNFQFPQGKPVLAGRSGYRRIHEQLDDPAPPRFEKIHTFNYEASVS